MILHKQQHQQVTDTAGGADPETIVAVTVEWAVNSAAQSGSRFPGAAELSHAAETADPWAESQDGENDSCLVIVNVFKNLLMYW